LTTLLIAAVRGHQSLRSSINDLNAIIDDIDEGQRPAVEWTIDRLTQTMRFPSRRESTAAGSFRQGVDRVDGHQERLALVCEMS